MIAPARNVRVTRAPVITRPSGNVQRTWAAAGAPAVNVTSSPGRANAVEARAVRVVGPGSGPRAGSRAAGERFPAASIAVTVRSCIPGGSGTSAETAEPGATAATEPVTAATGEPSRATSNVTPSAVDSRGTSGEAVVLPSSSVATTW